MTCPNKEVLLNYSLCISDPVITATRSAHHNIDTLTAVGKTDRLWSSLSLCPTVRSAAVSASLSPTV